MLWSRLREKRGIARFTALLLALVAVMVILAAIPVWRHVREEFARNSCMAAMDSAYRQIAVDYLMVNGTPTAKDVQDVVSYAMHGWDDLCPGGGTVYVVEDKSGSGLPYRVVCGLHDEDTALTTRLNASYVLRQIEEAVRRARSAGEPYPASVTVTLHHKELEALLVDDFTGLRRGTATTAGVEGIVAYYSIVGHSAFGEDSGLEEGEVWYFSYADENHCAAWSSARSWTGDCYP